MSNQHVFSLCPVLQFILRTVKETSTFLLRKTYLSDGQKEQKLMKYEELFIEVDADRYSAASPVTQSGLKRDVAM